MTLEELLSFLEGIKYDLKPKEEYSLFASESLEVYIFWGGNFTNVGYYPVVQVEYNDKTIFHREGTENPQYWYRVVDQAMDKIREVTQ